jgi:hypothetical protein
MDLINKSQYEFTDISSEEYRTYNFVGGGSETIKSPTHLAVSATGHRVFDESGESHYIFLDKVASISWKAKEGKPHFVK